MPTQQSSEWKQRFLTFGEGIVVLIVGIILEFTDEYFTINNKHIGLLMTIVGSFIIISRYISTEVTKENIKNKLDERENEDNRFKESVMSSLQGTEKHIQKISNLIDIREESKVDTIKKMLDIYLNITEKEFSKVKDGILTEAINSLNKLKNNKRSEELASSEYYEWLLPILNNIGTGQSIKAVSCMFDTEWDDSPAEQKFIQGNVNAGKRGATVERIFIMKNDILDEALKIPAVSHHTVEEKETYQLNGFYADREKIERKEPKLIDDIGHGFILFNRTVALIDKFDEGGQVRGVVTMNEYDIRALEKIFSRLRHYSVPLKKTP